MECNNLSITLFFPPLLKTGCKGRFKYEKDGGKTEMEEEMKGVGQGEES